MHVLQAKVGEVKTAAVALESLKARRVPLQAGLEHVPQMTRGRLDAM
jgi:hypothetical protein